MGYYTKYMLTAHDSKNAAFYTRENSENFERVRAAAKALVYTPYFGLYVDHYGYEKNNPDPFYFVNEDEMKWYDCEFDLEKLSKEFPDLWFRLEGNGEESGDEWVIIFHNGKQSGVSVELHWPPIPDIWGEE